MQTSFVKGTNLVDVVGGAKFTVGEAGGLTVQANPRQVLLLRGCVQPALAPNIEAATQRVLAALGVGAVGLLIGGAVLVTRRRQAAIAA